MTSVIGVDVGGTKARLAVVDDRFRVELEDYALVNTESQATLLDGLCSRVEAMLESVPEVEAVGFGIPCTIDERQAIAVNSVHLPIENLPFGRYMQRRLGLPVWFDNDANLAALVEHRHGAGKGSRVVLAVTIGTGIGGGAVIDGRPFRGTIGAGTEFGHMTIEVDGRECSGTCPGRGCLETVVSGTALAREGNIEARRNPNSLIGRVLMEGRTITAPDVTEAAQAGDRVARGIFARMGRYFGAGLASLINAFNPDVIVVGGGVSAAGELLLGPARVEALARALPPARDVVHICRAQFGQDAGMLGAAVLARDGILGRPMPRVDTLG